MTEMFSEMADSQLRARLEKAWCKETANVGDQWKPETPSAGQCAVTALLIQDLVGGDILRGEINGGSHYWNQIALPTGAEIDVDLTRDQFGAAEGLTPTNVEVRTRQYLLSNRDTSRRYTLLKQRFAVSEVAPKKVVEEIRQAAVEVKNPVDPTIESIQKDCWQTAEDHGWHQGTIDGSMFVEKLCLLHSELSEALEEYRNDHAYTEVYYAESGKPEGIPIELADVAIRLFDLAEIFGIKLGSAIEEKQAFNKTRPFRHGGKKA